MSMLRKRNFKRSPLRKSKRTARTPLRCSMEQLENRQLMTTTAFGDFDGDGFEDMAVGTPLEQVGRFDSAGVVQVVYGSGAGLHECGSQTWHQDSPGILGAAESGDLFGSALAAGDFNGDGFDDLAIGVKGEDIGTVAGAGAVNVIYGSPSGLTSRGNHLFHQNTPGIRGVAERGDDFGSALVAANFNGDINRATGLPIDDLAIGVPGEDISGERNAGAVNVIYGSSNTLTSRNNQLWHQNITGIKGKAEDRDLFGSSLTAGDFNGDGRADLAVGVRGETMEDLFFDDTGAGAVNVIYANSRGLTSIGNQIWHQDVSGIKGKAEGSDTFANLENLLLTNPLVELDIRDLDGDQFGAALASGDFNGDGFDDLLVGVPGETIGGIAGFFDVENAGAVNVIYGSSSGLTSEDDQMFHQDSNRIQGRAELEDQFGFAVAAGDFNRDGYDDVAISVSRESLGRTERAGAVHIIYGSDDGLRHDRNQLWTQDTPGILERAETGDHFGRGLAVGDINGDSVADISIQVRDGLLGGNNILYGTPTGLSARNNQLWLHSSGLLNARGPSRCFNVTTDQMFVATRSAMEPTESGPQSASAVFQIDTSIPSFSVPSIAPSIPIFQAAPARKRPGSTLPSFSALGSFASSGGTTATRRDEVTPSVTPTSTSNSQKLDTSAVDVVFSAIGLS